MDMDFTISSSKNNYKQYNKYKQYNHYARAIYDLKYIRK